MFCIPRHAIEIYGDSLIMVATVRPTARHELKKVAVVPMLRPTTGTK